MNKVFNNLANCLSILTLKSVLHLLHLQNRSFTWKGTFGAPLISKLVIQLWIFFFFFTYKSMDVALYKHPRCISTWNPLHGL